MSEMNEVNEVSPASETSDVERLVMNLRLVAAWRTPGGATPKEKMPRADIVCSEAAELIEHAVSVIRLIGGKHAAGIIALPEADAERCREFMVHNPELSALA